MNDDLIRKKWEPIINSLIDNIKLNYEVEIEISKYLENKLINRTSDNDDFAQSIKDSFDKFKHILLTDNRYTIKVKNTYYNPLINDIIYKLENGDIISNNKKNNEFYYTKYIINLFYSIVDTPLSRQEKIKKIIKNVK